MRFFKYILFLFLTPVIVNSQTVHVDSNRVVYKETIKLDKIDKEELYRRAKHSILNNSKGNKETIIEDNSDKGSIIAEGSIRLPSPYHIIKTVGYVLELSFANGKYEYHIDSVYIKEVERGGKTVKISSEELLKGMGVSGPAAAKAEKQLNEIDMNFQKLIALLKAGMIQPGEVKKDNL